MFPILNLGPLSLPLPEFVLLIGFWMGTIMADRTSRSLLSDPGFIDRLLWSSMLAGILGARISYFARNPAAFNGDFLSLFSLNFNLFDLVGGLLIALAVTLYIVSQSRISLLLALDTISPFLAVFLASIHLSKLARGTGFGSLTDLPWGINLWGSSRHPVQLYYFLASIIVLISILFILSKYSYTQGLVFFIFSLFTCSYLLFFSRFEVSNIIIFAGIRLNQLFYWTGSLISLVFLNKLLSINYRFQPHEIDQ